MVVTISFLNVKGRDQNELYDPSSSEEVTLSEPGPGTELSETEICDIIKYTGIYNCENIDALAF